MIRLACHLDTYFHRGGQGLISTVGVIFHCGGVIPYFHCRGVTLNFHCRGVEAGDSRFSGGVPDSFWFPDSFLICFMFLIRSITLLKDSTIVLD